MTVPATTALAACEQVIEHGLGTFIEVGQALLAIRDERLYRENHSTFEDYCRVRWALSRSRAYQFIDAAEVSTVVDVANEAQARELAGLPVETQCEVFAAAHEATEGKPTASAIREAREVIAPRHEPVKVTVRDTHTTAEQFIAQRDTGEVLSPEQWEQQQNQPDQPVPDTLAAARAEAARHPSIVTGEAMKHLERARRALLAAGTPTEILADHDTDPIDTTGDWLYEIDASIAVLTPLAAALRRRHIRSVK